MIAIGATAPDFSLPGIVDGEPRYYDLVGPLGAGMAAVLLWYPCDFVPTITPDLLAASAWADRDDLVVYGMSSDSLFAHEAYASREGITMPLLADTHATAADAYGLVAEAVRGHHAVPARAVVAIGPDWTVEYAWRATEPLAADDRVPFGAVADALAPRLDDPIDAPT